MSSRPAYFPSPSVYADHITLSATGTTTYNIGIRPEFIQFDAHPNVHAMNVDSGAANANDIQNMNGSMKGYAVRQPDGAVNQFCQCSVASGYNTNTAGWYSSDTYAVGVRYQDTDGNLLGRTLAKVQNITEDGFDLTVDQVDRNQLVFFMVTGV